MDEQTKKPKINKKELWRTIKFTLFSISAGVIQFAVSALLELVILKNIIPADEIIYFIISMGKRNFIAQTIGLAMSIIWNFTFNRKFTFKAANNIPIAMLLAFVFYIPFYPFQIWYTDVVGKALIHIGDWGFLIKTGTVMIINFVLEYLWQTFVVFRGSIDKNDVAKKEQGIDAEQTADEKQENVIEANQPADEAAAVEVVAADETENK